MKHTSRPTPRQQLLAGFDMLPADPPPAAPVTSVQQPAATAVDDSPPTVESGATRVGEAITRPDADYVRDVTGFAIGGVPPIGHLQQMETYIDEDFLQYETIWAAAGTPNAIFELKTADLQKMTGGSVVRVK